MAFWETDAPLAEASPAMREYAEIWRVADKVVYSRTLSSVSTARTRLERDFAPEAVLELKGSASSDVSVGGADLAAQAIAAGLVDELQLLVVPVVVGGGKRAFPDGVRSELELLDTRPFAGGTVFLRYRVRA
jgi:dihydrofolate reductase